MLVLNKPSGPGAESFVARMDLMRSSFLGGDVRPNLNLSFILFKVGCPLRVIFDRGLKPKLSRGKHGS